ncbi:protein-tyrosine phosphatase-like protein [Mucor lusitanicus]
MSDNSKSLFVNQAFNPFFSNIRQNMELSPSGIKERIPVRFPEGMQYKPENGSVMKNGKDQPLRHCVGMLDNYTLPPWLQRCLAPDTGETLIAKSYEQIENSEQKRLKGVMAHHCQAKDSFLDHPFSIVSAMEKGALNRYNNIWPFEYNRVKLRNKTNDYINASYIQYSDVDTALASSSSQVPTLLSLQEQNDTCGTGRRYPKYISTQGPLPATFDDFWAVVWDENSSVIVMLTKEAEMNRIKCHRYWPTEAEKSKTFGSITIQFVSETEQLSTRSTSKSDGEIEDGITLRILEIRRDDGQESRIIHHFHYSGWQDHGVPDNPLGTLKLVELAQKSQTELKQQHKQNAGDGPMIVHCSAGCGRTGADPNHLNEEERAGEIDLVYQTVSKFREQRMSMVQTLRQLVFVYEAILWWILRIDCAQQQ